MGFWAGFVQELNRIEDRNERRELFLQETMEKRRDTLLQLGLKQRERDAKAQDFAKDIAWVKNRLPDNEEANEYLLKLKVNPENANIIRETIEKAEADAAKAGVERRISGVELIETFNIIGDNLDNPNFMKRFENNGGDVIEALLTGEIDVSDPEAYSEAFMDLLQPTTDTSVTVDVTPSVLPSPERSSKIVDVLNTRLISLATERLNKLQEAGQLDEASRLQTQINAFNEGKNFGLRRTDLGRQAYEEVLESNPEVFGPQSTNPYLLDWRKDYESTQPAPLSGFETPEAPQVPVATPQAPASFKEGATAVHPQTGERLILKNGQWVPINE